MNLIKHRRIFGWLIVLVGAHIARHTQHPHRLRHHVDGPRVEQIHDQALALDVMAAIGRIHYFDEPKWTLESLTASGCYGSPDQVEQLLRALRARGLIVATSDEPEAYLPARAIETIGLRELLDIAPGHRTRARRRVGTPGGGAGGRRRHRAGRPGAWKERP